MPEFVVETDSRYGRERKYSQSLANEIVSHLYEGKQIGETAQLVGISSQTIGRWRIEFPDFNEAVTRALDASHDQLADTLLTAHEDIDDAQKAKLYSDNVKWLLAKRDKRYGDKLNIEVDQRISLVDAINEAKGRVLSASYQRIDDEAETPAIASIPAPQARDIQSGEAPKGAESLDDLLK